MATWNLGDIVASTLPSYEKEFKDQVFNKHVLLSHFKENDGVVEKSGGYEVRVPLMTNAGVSEWFGDNCFFGIERFISECSSCKRFARI